MKRSIVLSLFAALALGAIYSPSALAAKPCHAVRFQGHKAKVGVIGVDCPSARRRIELFYERWDPLDGPYLTVEGFRCAGTSAGTDVSCRSRNRWIYATTRPYVDIRDIHPRLSSSSTR